MKARIIALVLACLMLLGNFSSVAALTDVDNTKYESAVESLEILGIVNGYEDGTYKPEKEVTRAEMAKLLVVAIGMDTAADLYKGTTRFTDIAANHWATGFINIAVDKGIINGYPDGTFAPDAPVKYSEAITMVVRALGYKTMVEDFGTWPINYIAKAQDLKILKDVEYKDYTHNATRGNTALLLWNALTIPTWGVIGQTQGDGLSYNYTDSLLTQHFENYTYVKDLVVKGIKVENEKVYVSFDKELYTELEKDTDFLNLLGRTVTVLYNVEDDKIVLLTPSIEDKVVCGNRDKLVEDDYVFGSGEKIWGTANSGDKDYTVGVIVEDEEIEYSTRYALEDSVVVEKVELKNDNKILKINSTELSIPEEAIVLVDGVWGTIEDVKVGDVITVLEEDELYIVARNAIVGDLEDITKSANNYYITIDGVKYDIPDIITNIEVLNSKDEVIKKETLYSILKDKDSKYWDKEVVVDRDFLGNIVRITTDEIIEKDMGNFCVVNKDIWSEKIEGDLYRYIKLNGNAHIIKDNAIESGDIHSGDAAYVKLDKKDRVEEIYSLKNLPNHTFEIATADKDLYKDNKINDKYRVVSNTVIVKISEVKEDKKVIEYTSKIVGIEALEGVTEATLVFDKDEKYGKIAYIFVEQDAKDTDKRYGLVTEFIEGRGGYGYLVIDGEEEKIEDENAESYSGDIIEYTINDTIEVSNIYDTSLLEPKYVVSSVDADGLYYELDGLNGYYSLEEKVKDLRVLYVEYEDNAFVSVEEIDVEDAKVEKDDILVRKASDGLFFIIREK